MLFVCLLLFFVVVCLICGGVGVVSVVFTGFFSAPSVVDGAVAVFILTGVIVAVVVAVPIAVVVVAAVIVFVFIVSNIIGDSNKGNMIMTMIPSP